METTMNPIIRSIAVVLVAIPLVATAASAESGHLITAAPSKALTPADVVVPPHGPHTCIGWRRYCHNR